jgi:Cu-Zn family superoxide dismutase
MKKITLVCSMLFLLTIVNGCKSTTTNDVAGANTLKVTFQAKSGSKSAGSAVFSENKGKVTFTATLSGLKPGVHAIHIHEKSDCSAPDAASAGGHWNPTFKNHGKWGRGDYHKGDIGNFTTDEFGNGMITVTTKEWCLGCADSTKNVIGKSLIVHAGPDDYVTQPSGNAGGRVACTALIR